jgi:6-phosphogluconolactonase (cycloisomerase 2 family)
VLSDDGRWLFAVNAGSDDLSVFAVTADGLAPVDRVDAGGVRPTSVTAHQALLYVLSTAARTTQPACTASRSATTARSRRWRDPGAS